jgi:hypothetical protein
MFTRLRPRNINSRTTALFSWNRETSKMATHALASYRKNALPVLTDISSRTSIKELKDYALDKIKEVNEGKSLGNSIS